MISEPAGKAYPLELSIEGPLRHIIVCKRSDDLRRDRLSTGEVDHLHRITVCGIPEEKNIEICRLGIFVDATLGKVHTAVGFNINTECFHIHESFL